MSKTTTAAGILMLAALSWLAGTALAGPQRSPVSTGAGSTQQPKKPWGCEGTPNAVECSMCCMLAAAILSEACTSRGFSEVYCQSKAHRYLDTCEEMACGF